MFDLSFLLALPRDLLPGEDPREAIRIGARDNGLSAHRLARSMILEQDKKNEELGLPRSANTLRPTLECFNTDSKHETGKPRVVCPQCIRENKPLYAIHQVAPLAYCLFHRLRLLTHCPRCKKSNSWCNWDGESCFHCMMSFAHADSGKTETFQERVMRAAFFNVNLDADVLDEGAIHQLVDNEAELKAACVRVERTFLVAVDLERQSVFRRSTHSRRRSYIRSCWHEALYSDWENIVCDAGLVQALANAPRGKMYAEKNKLFLHTGWAYLDAAVREGDEAEWVAP